MQRHIFSGMRQLRAKGLKVGVVKPRLFRPFPAAQIVDAIKGCQAVAVLDRAISFGALHGAGPLFGDITSALFNMGIADLQIINYIFGLGGRDTLPSHIESVFQDLQQIATSGDRGETVRYLGLRG